MSYATVWKVDLEKACNNYVAWRLEKIALKRAALIEQRKNSLMSKLLKRSTESVIRSLESDRFSSYTMMELFDGYRYCRVMELLDLAAVSSNGKIELDAKDAWIITDFLKVNKSE